LLAAEDIEVNLYATRSYLIVKNFADPPPWRRTSVLVTPTLPRNVLTKEAKTIEVCINTENKGNVTNVPDYSFFTRII
jgi:hypothetical protein